MKIESHVALGALSLLSILISAIFGQMNLNSMCAGFGLIALVLCIFTVIQWDKA